MLAAAETGSRRRWSTEEVEPRLALAYWVETICQSFLEIDIDSPEAGRFQGRLDSTELGSGSLYIVQAGAQNVRRTPARIARSREAYGVLMQVRTGRQLLRQYGRECVVQSGDCVLVDCKEPYSLDCLGPTRSVVLRVRLDWLGTWLPSVEDVAARPFHRGDGWGGALSAALGGLDGFVEGELALPGSAVAEQLAALLALAAGPHVRATRGPERLYRRLLSNLRERCGDAQLAPTQLAEDHGISPRYLHHLFAHAGTTFGAELLRVRMELAQRLLSDRRYAAVSILEIAARCGFADPSHFARRFRRAFGHGPAAFRCRGGPSVDQ